MIKFDIWVVWHDEPVGDGERKRQGAGGLLFDVIEVGRSFSDLYPDVPRVKLCLAQAELIIVQRLPNDILSAHKRLFVAARNISFGLVL
jgi:hypothetical protein